MYVVFNVVNTFSIGSRADSLHIFLYGSDVRTLITVQLSQGHQIRRRRRAARSLTSQGRAEPLCARITGLNREVSEGKADL